ncbi:MAG: DNA recombination protein RmuC [Ilumatobacteraceae bacterium]|nr:DNA recombination protein RmuC [Ilumatobacteraceae bacterium]
MEVFVGLAGGLVVAVVAVLVVIQRKPGAAAPAPVAGAQPTLSAADIRDVIREIHGETLRDLADQNKDDRQDVISTAARQVGEAIDTTKKQIDEKMGRLETEISKLREANSEKFGNVDSAVAGLAQQTQALNKVLSSSQGRGNWGEKMLVDILMQAGFERGINYEMQEKLEGGGKPDFTFHLPPDRVLYLDSKFPMENYIKYFEAQDDNTRKIMKDAFIENVEDRVKELQDRDYVQQSNANALDYVLLFIPNEGVLGFIQQHKPSLIDEAVAKRVVLCSPLTLYAFLGVVRQATASFAMEKNANEVLRLLTNFGKAWGSYVKNLKEISGHFEKMQKKLKAVTTGRVFSGVNKPLREIEELAKSRGISSDNSAMKELDAALAEADATEADDDE